MSDAGFPGQAGVTAANAEVNSTGFHVSQKLARTRTMIPVKVLKVKGGGIDKPGTLSVQPLINLTDGTGNMLAHGPVHGIPYTRNQAGTGAIINDPQVGDVGTLVVADRDISTLKATGQQSNPGSKRRFSMSDGVYHANMLGQKPTTYVYFKPDGTLVLQDKNGAIVETLAGGAVAVVPGRGANVFLGGDGTQGSYDFVQTVSGQPAINVKVRTA